MHISRCLAREQILQYRIRAVHLSHRCEERVRNQEHCFGELVFSVLVDNVQQGLLVGVPFFEQMRLEIENDVIHFSNSLNTDFLDREPWVVDQSWVMGSFKLQIWDAK